MVVSGHSVSMGYLGMMAKRQWSFFVDGGNESTLKFVVVIDTHIPLKAIKM